MDPSGQRLAKQKTKFVLITSRKKLETIILRVDEHDMVSQTYILGSMIDGEQIEHASTRASLVGKVYHHTFCRGEPK